MSVTSMAMWLQPYTWTLMALLPRLPTTVKLVGRRFPDQFGDDEHQLDVLLLERGRRRLKPPHLARYHADRVVQESMLLVARDVPRGPDHLTPPRWVRAAVPLVVHHDESAIVGLDEALHVHGERLISASSRMIAGSESPCDGALAASFREIVMMLLSAAGSGQFDVPTVRIDEAHRVECAKLHVAALSPFATWDLSSRRSNARIPRCSSCKKEMHWPWLSQPVLRSSRSSAQAPRARLGPRIFRDCGPSSRSATIPRFPKGTIIAVKGSTS